MWSKSITLEVRKALKRENLCGVKRIPKKLIFDQLSARMWQNVMEFRWSSARGYEFPIIAGGSLSTAVCRQVLQFTIRKSIKIHSPPAETRPVPPYKRIVQKNIAQQRKPDLPMSLANKKWISRSSQTCWLFRRLLFFYSGKSVLRLPSCVAENKFLRHGMEKWTAWGKANRAGSMHAVLCRSWVVREASR